jgi:hypothetical protein
MFHNLGLTTNYGRTDCDEIDGRYVAWDFLFDNGSSRQEARTPTTRRLALNCSSLPAPRNRTEARSSPSCQHPAGKLKGKDAGWRC